MRKGIFFVPILLAFTILSLLLGIISSPPSQAADLKIPQGAVALNGSHVQGEAVPDISNILGATYDEDREEIILFGIADETLPPLDFDYLRENLLLFLASYYNPALDVPGVSIEGTLDPLDVIYFGGVENTRAGQVSFEADRLLKIYTLGVDNLTNNPVTSAVPGYMSYPDRVTQYEETETDPISIRYFYTPTIYAKEVTTPHTIIFSHTEKLVDWAYTSSATSSASTQAAQGFVENFNDHYLDYAAERQDLHDDTTLYEVIQLAKLSAIAQWAHDEGLDDNLAGLHLPWLDDYPITFSPTVDQTPGITVTFVQTITGNPYNVSLRGGAYLPGTVIIKSGNAGDQVMADAVVQNSVPIASLKTNYVVNIFVEDCLVDPFNFYRAAVQSCPIGSSSGKLVGQRISVVQLAERNGGFEAGPSSGWGQISPEQMIRTESPFKDIYSAIFPATHNRDVRMYQDIYIPEDADKAEISYWRAAATTETGGTHDTFSAYLTTPGGTPLTTLENLDDSDADGIWREVSFDVSDYIGQDVRLWFRGTTDESEITNFFVDEVHVEFLDLVAPSVTTIDSTGVDNGTLSLRVTFHERLNTAVTPTVVASLSSAFLTGVDAVQGTVYTATAKTEAGYTNGYLDSDPTQWFGEVTGLPDATVTIEISVTHAQDVGKNVMYASSRSVTLLDEHIYLPIVINP